jgi:PPP family 3-phenylpropionic acid transporter
LWALGVLAEVLFFWGQGRWFARLSAPGWLILAGWVTALRFGAIAAGGRWIAVLVLAQLLHAVTFAAHHSACMAVVQQHFPGRLRGRGQALCMGLGYGLSGILGGFSGGWLIDQAGYAAMFWAASASGALAAICAGSMRRTAVRAAA